MSSVLPRSPTFGAVAGVGDILVEVVGLQAVLEKQPAKDHELDGDPSVPNCNGVVVKFILPHEEVICMLGGEFNAPV